LREAQNRNLLNGQALHAKVLELTHPRTLERMRFECEMPTNMQSLIEKLRAQNND